MNLPADSTLPNFAKHYSSLALERLGARIIGASDEFFAPAARIIDEKPPVFIPGKYDEHGKWMDGWETRRRRVEGYDWLVFDLGAPAVITGFDIDTSHFNGNQPSEASIEASATGDESDMQELVGRTALRADSHHWLAVKSKQPWRMVRLNIYPDGGVARLRTYGSFQTTASAGEVADLASVSQGARVIAYSDAHFGAPEKLLMPGRGINMGDGWETRRRRGPGFDWVVIALGCPGILQRAEIDTAHFKGNYPASCTLQATALDRGSPDSSLASVSDAWPEVLSQSELTADSVHTFDLAASDQAATHVRLNIYPDGGVSRLRIYAAARP